MKICQFGVCFAILVQFRQSVECMVSDLCFIIPEEENNNVWSFLDLRGSNCGFSCEAV
jgi:hypothetical protein